MALPNKNQSHESQLEGKIKQYTESDILCPGCKRQSISCEE